jgi:hypothetical protein
MAPKKALGADSARNDCFSQGKADAKKAKVYGRIGKKIISL